MGAVAASRRPMRLRWRCGFVRVDVVCGVRFWPVVVGRGLRRPTDPEGGGPQHEQHEQGGDGAGDGTAQRPPPHSRRGTRVTQRQHPHATGLPEGRRSASVNSLPATTPALASTMSPAVTMTTVERFHVVDDRGRAGRRNEQRIERGDLNLARRRE